MAAQKIWKLRSYDTTSTFLQSEGIERLLLLQIPQEQPPPGTQPGEIVMAKAASTEHTMQDGTGTFTSRPPPTARV